MVVDLGAEALAVVALTIVGKEKIMKLSELIKDVVWLAEEEFGTTDHINDNITIGMHVGRYEGPDQYQVWLERPTLKQLWSGEVLETETIKQYESLVALFTKGDTLLSALLDLKDKLENVGFENSVEYFQSVDPTNV